MRFKKPWLKNWIRRDGQQSQTLLIPKSVEYCFDCPILVIPNVIGCLTGFHGRRKCMYVLVHWLMHSGYGVPTPGVHVLLFVFFFSLLNRKSLQFFLLLFRIYKHTCHRRISTMRHRARAVDFIIAVRAQFHFSRFFLLSFLTMKEMYLHN